MVILFQFLWNKNKTFLYLDLKSFSPLLNHQQVAYHFTFQNPYHANLSRSCYFAKHLESVFVEIDLPKKSNIIPVCR